MKNAKETFEKLIKEKPRIKTKLYPVPRESSKLKGGGGGGGGGDLFVTYCELIRKYQARKLLRSLPGANGEQKHKTKK